MDILELGIGADAIIQVQNGLALGANGQKRIHRSHRTAQNIESRFQREPAVERQFLDFFESQLLEGLHDPRRTVSLIQNRDAPPIRFWDRLQRGKVEMVRVFVRQPDMVHPLNGHMCRGTV